MLRCSTIGEGKSKKCAALKATAYEVANDRNSYHGNIAETTNDLLLIVYYMICKYTMKKGLQITFAKKGQDLYFAF